MFSDYSIDCIIEGFFFNDVDTDQMILWLNSIKSVRDVSIELSDSQLVLPSNVMLEHGNRFISAILEWWLLMERFEFFQLFSIYWHNATVRKQGLVVGFRFEPRASNLESYRSILPGLEVLDHGLINVEKYFVSFLDFPHYPHKHFS